MKTDLGRFIGQAMQSLMQSPERYIVFLDGVRYNITWMVIYDLGQRGERKAKQTPHAIAGDSPASEEPRIRRKMR